MSFETDKELARCAVDVITLAGCGQCPFVERKSAEFCWHGLLPRLTLAPLRTVIATSRRIPALDETVGNYAMKSEPVIKALTCQFLEVLYVFWSDLREESNGEFA